MHLFRLAQCELGVRAADRSRSVNAIARLKFIDVHAHLLDHARAVVARRVRQGWL